MLVIVTYIYIQKEFSCKTFLYTQKQKKRSFLCKEYIYIFNPKYCEFSWAIKMKLCIVEKSKNSIVTELCADLIKNIFKIHIFSARQNLMPKLCRVLIKHENKIKIGWKNYYKTLQFSHMRSCVEKGVVLGWTSYLYRWFISAYLQGCQRSG